MPRYPLTSKREQIFFKNKQKKKRVKGQQCKALQNIEKVPTKHPFIRKSADTHKQKTPLKTSFPLLFPYSLFPPNKTKNTKVDQNNKLLF